MTPAYANDPTGFWASARAAGVVAWAAVLPGAVIQADLSVMADDIKAAINWMPVKFSWRGYSYSASLSSNGITGDLEPGGIFQSGAITLVCLQTDFDGAYPELKDQIILTSNGADLFYQISGISPVIDGNDPSFTITAEPIGDE